MIKDILSRLKKGSPINIVMVMIVCLSFAIMAATSVFFVTFVVNRQMDSIARETMNSMETSVEDNLFAKGLLFTEISRGVRRLDKQSLYNNVEITNCLTDIQSFFTNNDSPIDDFLKVYAYINGEFIDGSGWIPPADFYPTERPWYTDAVSANGQVSFSDPYIDADSGEVCVSYSQVIMEKGGEYDVIAIDLTLDSIIREIAEQQIAGDGYGIFLCDEYSFIVHKNENYLSHTTVGAEHPDSISTICDGYAIIETMLRSKESVSGIRIKDFDGKDSVVFIRSLFNGWHIGIITPRASYISAAMTLGIIIGILGLALSSVLSLLLIFTRNRMTHFQKESQNKSNFLAKMSHELRTPMNAIIGMTEIAKHSKEETKVRYCLDRVDEASNHLLDMINNLLDMSKIDSGYFNITQEKVNMEAFIQRIKSETEEEAASNQQHFTLCVDNNVPPMVMVDGKHLHQVLHNLLDNALKYSAEGGTIKLTIQVEEQFEKHSLIKFEVQDDGIGIDDATKETLYKTFEQSDNSISRQYDGIGLGLPIAQTIVTMMGGKLMVESKVGEGACFYFSILLEHCDMLSPEKAENTSIQQENPERVSDGILKGKKLLIVEDVEVNRMIVVELLKETQIEIDEAENGQIALEKFQAAPDKYDIILMDVHMPVMDGITATKKIRSLDIPRAKKIPIIALTADMLKENIDKCIDAGMSAHTGKPVNIDVIISLIEKHT